ncbi:phage tail tip lysozyme [Staphylococcus hominis]
MSNKRKHVEFESELDNSEKQSNDDYGVEDPSRQNIPNNHQPNTSSNNQEGYDQDNGGQDKVSSNAPKVSDTSEEGNTNNKVFDGKNINDNTRGNQVETDGGRLSNHAPNQKLDDNKGNNNQQNRNNDNQRSDNNKSNNNQQDKNSDSQKDKTNNNLQNDKNQKNKKPTKDKEKNNKGSNNNSQQDKKSSAIKGSIGDKLGNYSDTANKINKLKDFNNLKNMSKEQASQEVIELGKDLAKKKLTALFVTYVAPYLIPIIVGLLAFILIIFIILAAITGSGSKNSSNVDCGPVNESTSIKASEDAEKNAQKIYEYEMKHVDGAKPKAVAAHLGNMWVESAHTFNPKTIQGNNSFKESIANDPTVGGYAFGIAQWDSGRRVNLLKHAKKEGKKWDDFGLQLDFLLNHDDSDSGVIKKLLKSDGSIDTITERIMNEWERAGDKSSLSQRQSAASKYYSKFGKKDVSSDDGNLDEATDAASDNSDASENSGCNDTGDTGGSGEIGESVKANGKSGEIKEVWDSKSDIPAKYKKHIKIPDFKEKVLHTPLNIFPVTGNKGQCTELTWGYMKQMYGGNPPANGNGNVIYKAYEAKGAKVTSNPTVGYGFSSNPPYAGAADASVGHTGIVVGVMKNGDWIMANYNLKGEGNMGQRRSLTYALVDGNKKEGGIKFFSGIGKPKVKSKD